MTDGSVFDLFLAGLNRAHDYIADVGANAGLQIQPLLRAQALGEVAYVFLHSQSRAEGALRMIFVRNRRAEQGKDTVAGGLYDISTVAACGVDHELQSRIDDLARFLRVEVLH